MAHRKVRDVMTAGVVTTTPTCQPFPTWPTTDRTLL